MYIRNCISGISTAQCLMVTRNPFPGCVCALLLLFVSCHEQPQQVQMEWALGTVCIVNLNEGGSSELYARIFARIREIDRTMTVHVSEFQDLLGDTGLADTLVSGVVAINRQAGIAPVRVRADLIEVLERAVYYAGLSSGAFDPTIGPLVQLWNIGTDTQRIPDDDEIAAALELVDWRDLIIDREEGTVFLRREGMALDLGAIAKGYAADEAARIAREGGAVNSVIDLGGNIMALGRREQQTGEPRLWRIGIQHPLGDRGSFIGVVPASDTSVVTSGVYERFFESEGRRYHHLLSAASGFPADNGLLSVTVVYPHSMDADALATALFILGFERGRELIDSIPGAEAIFIFDDLTLTITGGLDGIFTLISDEFTFRL